MLLGGSQAPRETAARAVWVYAAAGWTYTNLKPAQLVCMYPLAAGFLPEIERPLPEFPLVLPESVQVCAVCPGEEKTYTATATDVDPVPLRRRTPPANTNVAQLRSEGPAQAAGRTAPLGCCRPHLRGPKCALTLLSANPPSSCMDGYTQRQPPTANRSTTLRTWAASGQRRRRARTAPGRPSWWQPTHCGTRRERGVWG